MVMRENKIESLEKMWVTLGSSHIVVLTIVIFVFCRIFSSVINQPHTTSSLCLFATMWYKYIYIRK